MMSNCLLARALALLKLAQATAQSPAQMVTDPLVGRLMLWTVAVGICTLGAWMVSAAANPSKLTLKRTPARPNNINPGHVVLPLALLIVVTGAAGRAMSLWFAADSPQLEISATLAGQIVWLPAALAVAAVGFRHGLSRGLGLSLRRWKYDTFASVIACLSAIPICFGLALLGVALVPPELQNSHMMLTAVDQLPAAWGMLIGFSVIVLAPLTEEVFFRGLIQSMLRKYLGGPWRAIGATSVLFGLMHYQQPQHVLSLVGLGVVLGYLYERHGRLYGPIVVHALFNALNLAAWLNK